MVESWESLVPVLVPGVSNPLVDPIIRERQTSICTDGHWPSWYHSYLPKKIMLNILLSTTKAIWLTKWPQMAQYIDPYRCCLNTGLMSSTLFFNVSFSIYILLPVLYFGATYKPKYAGYDLLLLSSFWFICTCHYTKNIQYSTVQYNYVHWYSGIRTMFHLCCFFTVNIKIFIDPFFFFFFAIWLC